MKICRICNIEKSINNFDLQSKILEKRDTRCKECVKKQKRLSVDHNHITGKIRGLLCSSCNVGLGVFKDSPDLLRKAIKYLDDND